MYKKCNISNKLITADTERPLELSCSMASPSTNNESGMSEFDLRLRQVDDVLNAAHRMLEGSFVDASKDAASTSSRDSQQRLRDIDAYLASKGINPSPYGDARLSARVEPFAGPSSFHAGLPAAAAAPSGFPVPESAARLGAPKRDTPSMSGAIGPMAPPDLRGADDSLASLLPFKFSMSPDAPPRPVSREQSRTLHSRSETTASGPPAPPRANAEPAHKYAEYHVLTLQGAAWRELSSRFREVGVPSLSGISSSVSDTEVRVDERELVEAVSQLLGLLARRAREALDVSTASFSSPAKVQPASGTSGSKSMRQLESEQALRAEDNARHAHAVKDLEDRLRVAQQQLADTKQKLAHSEHRVKRREAEVESMKHALAQATSVHRCVVSCRVVLLSRL